MSEQQEQSTATKFEPPEFNREVVLSVSHIPLATNLWLEVEYLKTCNALLVILSDDYNHRILITGDGLLAAETRQKVRELGHNELAELLLFAQANDCKWLVLDRDGPVTELFPRFEW